MKKPTNVGKEVLDVYTKENPSFIDIEQHKEFDKFAFAQKRLWQDLLKLPLRSFKDSQVLDFGCGTGEVDIFLALHGATVKGVDFNSISIDRAKKLSNQFQINDKVSFSVGDIHKQPFQPNSADFGISLGVLPHLKDAKRVFDNIIVSCKDGAFVILGFVEELGIVQRLLHRSIIRAIAGFDEDSIVKIARQAFPDHINRSIKYGQRSERSIIYDYLVNKHMYGLPLEKVLSWFKSSSINYYSSWPSIDLPFLISPYSSKSIELMNPVWREYRALLRLRWLFTQMEDDYVLSQIMETLKGTDLCISKLVNELSDLLATMVQEQKSAWTEEDQSSLNQIDTEIIRVTTNGLKQLIKRMDNELNDSFRTLQNIVSKINKLQNGTANEFKPINNFFRELNGIGTIYLTGVVNKK